jgi:hypothetical protein
MGQGSPAPTQGCIIPVMEWPSRYAETAGVQIAYQVIGDGPIDLVYSTGTWSNLQIMWQWPAWARYPQASSNLALTPHRSYVRRARKSQLTRVAPALAAVIEMSASYVAPPVIPRSVRVGINAR